MNIYSKLSRAVLLIALAALVPLQSILAQDLTAQKSEFMNMLKKANASSEDGKEFSVQSMTPFLNNSVFFSYTDDKLVLPFEGETMQTIPEWINTGGDKFDRLIKSKVNEQFVLDFLISSAAKAFGVSKNKIELKFLWYVEGNDKLKIGANSVVVHQSDKSLTAQMVPITQADIEISPNVMGGGVSKFFKQFEWNQKIEALATQD